VNYYRIHQKSLNFIYPFKFYSNFTNRNVSWHHFSWATQYVYYTKKKGLFCSVVFYPDTYFYLKYSEPN